jgi:hypothetical protein
VHIFKETTFEDVPVSTHVVGSVEIRGDYISVGVNSMNDSMASFYRIFNMPMDAFNAAPYPQNVYNWLVAPGSKFEGGTIVSGDAPSLAEKQVSLLTKIVVERDKALHGGYPATGLGVFQTDDVSIRNILGTAQMAALSKMSASAFSIDWRLADDSMVTLDADGFIAVSAGVMEHVKDCYAHSWTLKAAVEAAEDDATIDAIDVTAGWPANELPAE